MTKEADEEERWLRSVRPPLWSRLLTPLTLVAAYLPAAIIVACFLVLSAILLVGGQWLSFQLWRSFGWVK